MPTALPSNSWRSHRRSSPESAEATGTWSTSFVKLPCPFHSALECAAVLDAMESLDLLDEAALREPRELLEAGRIDVDRIDFRP
jgi:hypothetical protein